MMLDNVKKDDMEAWCMVMWGIWFDRNNFVHNQKSKSHEDSLNWIYALLYEFQRVRVSRFLFQNLPHLPLGGFLLLLDPLKFNSDVSVKANYDHIGIGVCIRNDWGGGGVRLLLFQKLCLVLPKMS
ncbi:hypothetical protein ACOSQ3_002520 [Xanthoceras sorbifolium]